MIFQSFFHYDLPMGLQRQGIKALDKAIHHVFKLLVQEGIIDNCFFAIPAPCLKKNFMEFKRRKDRVNYDKKMP